jgi:type II secretory pathway pseudopilin PulG
MFQVSRFKFRGKAFTLMELLIYSAILAISAGAIAGIFFTVSKSSLKTQAENEVNNQTSQLEEIFRQKIEASKSIKTLNGSLLTLNMVDNSTTTFSLSDNILYLEEGGSGQLNLNDPNKVKVTSLLFSPVAGLSSVAMGNHYAWSGNIGWLDFAYPGGNVQLPVGEGDLNGAAYALSNGSWILLNCTYANCCSASDFKVSSDADGNLSGWAWSESFGWINFSTTTPIVYGVTVATTTTANHETGEWDGYAWSENDGWISFNCQTGGDSQANICSTSNYKVLDLRSAKTGIKIDLTLEYNSSHPEQAISRAYTFVFNILTPSK